MKIIRLLLLLFFVLFRFFLFRKKKFNFIKLFMCMVQRFSWFGIMSTSVNLIDLTQFLYTLNIISIYITKVIWIFFSRSFFFVAGVYENPEFKSLILIWCIQSWTGKANSSSVQFRNPWNVHVIKFQLIICMVFLFNGLIFEIERKNANDPLIPSDTFLSETHTHTKVEK